MPKIDFSKRVFVSITNGKEKNWNWQAKLEEINKNNIAKLYNTIKEQLKFRNYIIEILNKGFN